jgi:hypothetical protein
MGSTCQTTSATIAIANLERREKRSAGGMINWRGCNVEAEKKKSPIIKPGLNLFSEENRGDKQIMPQGASVV